MVMMVIDQWFELQVLRAVRHVCPSLLILWHHNTTSNQDGNV